MIPGAAPKRVGAQVARGSPARSPSAAGTGREAPSGTRTPTRVLRRRPEAASPATQGARGDEGVPSCTFRRRRRMTAAWGREGGRRGLHRRRRPPRPTPAGRRLGRKRGAAVLRGAPGSPVERSVKSGKAHPWSPPFGFRRPLHSDSVRALGLRCSLGSLPFPRSFSGFTRPAAPRAPGSAPEP